jgi:hypothetical protein
MVTIFFAFVTISFFAAVVATVVESVAAATAQA